SGICGSARSEVCSDRGTRLRSRRVFQERAILFRALHRVVQAAALMIIVNNRTLRPNTGRRQTSIFVFLFVCWITLCGSALIAAQTKQGGGSKASDDDSFEILPPKVHQHVIQADQLAGAGKYDEAIAEYRAAIKEAGRPVFTAYLNMGSVYFYQQNNVAAVD